MSIIRTWGWSRAGWQADAAVPASDRGFRYGMSVFETVAVYQGRPLFLPDHLDRLARAAGEVVTEWPDALTVLIAQEAFPNGVLRVYQTAGDGGPAAPFGPGRIFLVFEETAFPGRMEVENGFRLGLSRAPLPCVWGGWKTGNYWPNVQAFQEARHQGWDEVLATNYQGGIVSAAMGNVFLKIAGQWRTPALACGARDGVVRAWVCRRWPVLEAPVHWDELNEVEDAFVTNSRLGVMPVAEIDGRILPDRRDAAQWAVEYRNDVLGA